MADPRGQQRLYLHLQDDQPQPSPETVQRDILARENEQLRTKLRNLEAQVRCATKILAPNGVPPRKR
jgi:hypothetical protein